MPGPFDALFNQRRPMVAPTRTAAQQPANLGAVPDLFTGSVTGLAAYRAAQAAPTKRQSPYEAEGGPIDLDYGKNFLPQPPVVPPDSLDPGIVQLSNALDRIERLTYLQLAASRGVVSEVGPIMTGDQIGNGSAGYQTLYKNNTEREVCAQVFVYNWTNPGEGVKLSFSQSPSDTDLFDIIANTANYASASLLVLLRPQQSIFVTVADVTQPLQQATVLRTRIFDPQSYVNGTGR